jgi:hypothetical protein
MQAYFTEINRVSILCKQLDLSLNPSKTQERLLCTKREKPDSPTLQLDGIEIELCDNVKYLGVLIDNTLRFESHVDNLVTKASQRMHIIRIFVTLVPNFSHQCYLKVLLFLFLHTVCLFCTPPFMLKIRND